MLGFGALGESALGEIPAPVLALTQDILQEIVTNFVDEKKLSGPPAELHHFTSLDTACRIVEGDDVRLSHAEYSNDQTEMEEAKETIRHRLNARVARDPFFVQVLADYQNLAPNLDAFIFCMSTGLKTATGTSQDMLSQWRAYGQDGRGICLTLNASDLARLVYNTPGLRINPVIYDRTTQRLFVDAILDRAFAAHSAGDPNARGAAVAALVYTTPLMKAPGFVEEQEWRLIFMPPAGVSPMLDFHPRRDFLAPYLTLNNIWFTLQPAMIAIPALAALLSPIRAAARVPPLVPITQIMVGPSGHAALTQRAMQKLVAQVSHRGAIPITISAIPYRSLA
jgi:Protein of unknown function (DUF2971)